MAVFVAAELAGIFPKATGDVTDSIVNSLVEVGGKIEKAVAVPIESLSFGLGGGLVGGVLLFRRDRN